MEPKTKADFYNALKGAGVEMQKHYRDYTTDELREAYGQMLADQDPYADVPRSDEPLDDYPGMHQGFDVPRRIDSDGRIWFQEEFRKAAYPKPRVRRRIQYLDSPAVTTQVTTGEYTETFEVAGTETRAAEVKVTLPSYQVGLYKHPNLPFRIHVYGDSEGFDLNEVEAFYGGPEHVPSDVKRIYVSNVLCYDIRTTVRAIEAEARRLQLTGMNTLEGAL